MKNVNIENLEKVMSSASLLETIQKSEASCDRKFGYEGELGRREGARNQTPKSVCS